MENSNFSVKKPVSVWNRDLSFSYKDFFKGLGKTTVSGISGNWEKVATNTTDTLAAIGIASDCSQSAWQLIQQALTQAIIALVREQAHHTDKKAELSEDELDKLLNPLESEELEINSDFFLHPSKLTILPTVNTLLHQWMVSLGMPESEAANTASRIDSYFVLALNNEWRERPNHYTCLKEKLDTPFTRATEREAAWSRYNAYLQQQVELPMFDESFGLKQLYILCIPSF